MPPWVNLTIRILSATVDVAAFVLLVIEGVPPDEKGQEGKRVSVTHTTRSSCRERCESPEQAETTTTVSVDPAQEPSNPSAIEKALDNDIGVLLVRLVSALLLAVATAVGLERLVNGQRRPPDAPEPAKRSKDLDKGSGGAGKTMSKRQAGEEKSTGSVQKLDDAEGQRSAPSSTEATWHVASEPGVEPARQEAAASEEMEMGA